MEDFYLINLPEQVDYSVSNASKYDDPLLDLFTRWQRGLSHEEQTTLFQQAWSVSPYDFLRMLFHLRKCYGGKKERHQFYFAIKWCMENHPEQISANFNQITRFGDWRDLLRIWEYGDETVRTCIIYNFCKQIKRDYEATQNDTDKRNFSSSVAKWAPTEGSSADRKWGMVEIFCLQLGWSHGEYRQRINELKKFLLTETIPTEKNRYHNKLLEYYRMNPNMNTAQYNTQHNTQYNIQHINHTAYDIIATLRFHREKTFAESSWREISYSLSKDIFKDCMCVCNVDPSMDSKKYHSPINVALSLSLLINNTNKNPIISFNKKPEITFIQGDTPTEQLKCLQNMKYGKSLDMLAVIQLLKNIGKIPKYLYIFTNTPANIPHSYSQVKEKPEYIIYWNLDCRWGSCSYNLDRLEEGIIEINGFTNEIYTQILLGRLYQWVLLRKILDGKDYADIRLV